MEQAFHGIVATVLSALGMERSGSGPADILIFMAVILAGFGLAWALMRSAPLILKNVDLPRIGIGLVLAATVVFVIAAALTGAFE